MGEEAFAEGAPEPTLLIVGGGEPLTDGIADAAARHGLGVERAPLDQCAQIAVAVAPDAVLLVGDAAIDGGTEALRLLSASPLAAVVPVVLFGDDDESLGQRLTAFRLGATAVLSRSASVDATAQRLVELVRDMPERAGPLAGRVGEASLDAFVQTIARELRSGILSVRGVGEHGGEEIRLVLGEGQGLTDAIQDFVGRVEQLIERTEVVQYEWDGDARGGLSLLTALGGEGADADTAPPIGGTRVLLADDDVARADLVAHELRGAGAIVVVVDPEGRGLGRARALDPQALVVGEKVVHGSGLDLVRRLRADARMRWAHMIVVPWDEVWTEKDSTPKLGGLMRRLARATKVERAIHDRIAVKKTFDVRLEALGATRLLRQLGLEQGSLRLTVWNLRGTVRVDVGQGLIIGARAVVPGRAGGVREGAAALACLLPMASGRARIEYVASPMTTNVMTPVEMALALAEQELPPGAPESPPHTLQQRAGGSMFPVAVAKTDRPPSGAVGQPEVDVAIDALDSLPPNDAVPSHAIVIGAVAPRSAVVHAEPDPEPEPHEPEPEEPEPDTQVEHVALPPPPPFPPEPRTSEHVAPPPMPPWPPEPPHPLAAEPVTPPAHLYPRLEDPHVAPPVEPVAMDPPHAGDAVAVRDRSVVPWVAAGLVVAVAATAGAWWVLGGRTGDAGSVAAVPPSTGTVTDPNAPADDATDEATPTEEAPPIAPIADDSTSDSEFAARVRPARPHRPPTPLHPLPEGADESFRVPEWMSELGPITRNARGDELRAVARRNLRSRRYDRALTWFRRSWWFEESAATASGIAETFLALGSSADALAWAQRAVELDADDVGSLVVLGDALRAEGRLGEARVAYEQVLEIRPGHREARRSLRRLRRLQRLHRRRGRAG